MNTISLKEARKRLSELINAVERGETIIITRRGKEVARLSPVARPRRRMLPDLEEHRASITVKGPSLSQTVLAERDEARY